MFIKLASLGAGLAACLALAATAGPAEAAFPGANGKVAFQRWGAGTGSDIPQIYVRDKGTTTPLTSVGANGAPTWSHDGTKIAFNSSRYGQLDIWVMNADGSKQIALTESPASDSNPSWSPTGLIAFDSERDDGLRSEIYVMNADGSNEKRLTFDPAHTANPAFSPDGKRIAFYRGDSSTHIWVMNADGSAQTQLTFGAVNDRAPTWSPDGKKLAFQRNNDIYVMDAKSGAAVTQYTNHPAIDKSPAFSPDGTMILFSSNRADGLYNFDIYSVSVQNVHDLKALTTDISADDAPDVAPTKPCTFICPP